MPERDRYHFFFNGKELSRLVLRTHRHTVRVIERTWRGYLIRFAHTNPDDTRLEPHDIAYAPDIAPTIDKIITRKLVLDAMAKGAWKYPDLETGEALVGVVPPYDGEGQEPAVQVVYILGTIAPDESTIREWGTVQMGDEDQYDRFLWLAENWYEDHQEDERWGRLPLQHLGDWHKQPSGMTMPSRGDFYSAKAILRDMYWRLPFILQPIVTLPTDTTYRHDLDDHNCITHTDERSRHTRIDFWYLSKAMRRYEPLTAIEVVGEEASDSLPRLAQLPWNLHNPQRMDFEEFSLKNDQRTFDALYFNTDDIPPLEYCLVVELPDSNTHLLVATHCDYPNSPPAAWVIDLWRGHADQGLLERVRSVWSTREPIEHAPEWHWSRDHSLSAYISMIETQLKARPAFQQLANGGVSE